jgi:hypothetical protein
MRTWVVDTDAAGVLDTGGGIVPASVGDSERIKAERDLSWTEDEDGGVPLERGRPIVAAG